MVAGYFPLKNLHLVTVAITLLMFVLRFCCLQTHCAMLQKHWVRIVPHLNDSLLLISGVLLLTITQFYPFSARGNWLTEKLFGVIIYLALSFIASGRCSPTQKVRWIAFTVAAIALLAVIRLAISKMPLLGFV